MKADAIVQLVQPANEDACGSRVVPLWLWHAVCVSTTVHDKLILACDIAPICNFDLKIEMLSGERNEVSSKIWASVPDSTPGT